MRLQLLVFQLTLTISATYVQAVCNECNDNGIACTNATSFHLCFGNGKVPDETQIFNCDDGFVCTAYAPKCVDVSLNPNLKPECEDTASSCGVCNPISQFSCNSRTTFAQCYDGEPSDNIGNCPQGLVCDATKSNVCVETSEVDEKNICNSEKPEVTTSTTTTTTTRPIATTQVSSTTTPSQAYEICASHKVPGGFPYDGDETCRKYVFCYYKNGVLIAISNICTEGTYFDKTEQICVNHIPTGCVGTFLTYVQGPDNLRSKNEIM